MKLKSDLNNKLFLDTTVGEVSLTDAIEIAAKRSGRTLHNIEEASGMTHSRLCNIRWPQRQNPAGTDTLLLAFLELGYDITIRKPGDS